MLFCTISPGIACGGRQGRKTKKQNLPQKKQLEVVFDSFFVVYGMVPWEEYSYFIYLGTIRDRDGLFEHKTMARKEYESKKSGSLGIIGIPFHSLFIIIIFTEDIWACAVVQ